MKPYGYHFHGKRHNNFQVLINWFKEHFKSKDYQRELRKTTSPRSKQSSVQNPTDILDVIGDRTRNPDTVQGGDWQNIDKNWQTGITGGGNSVHDDAESKYMKQETQVNSWGETVRGN